MMIMEQSMPSLSAVPILRIPAIRRKIVISGCPDATPSPPDACFLELNTGPNQAFAGKSLHDIHSEELSGFSKWQRPCPGKVLQPLQLGGSYLQKQVASSDSLISEEEKMSPLHSRKCNDSVIDCLELPRNTEVAMDDSGLVLDCLHGFLKLSGMVVANVQEKSLVEFLRAKKQQKVHFLDKIIVNEDVYDNHPWHYSGGDTKAMYFCCITKYTKRGNMTRDRMTKEGGRWKQQGIVQPILTAEGYGPAAKTYLSYIPRGKLTNMKGYFVHANAGRVKHRHRMIEIALEEDLKSEKRSLKHKVPPKPFLVICVLRKP